MLDEEINKTEADVMMLCNYGSYIQDSFSAWKLGLDRTSVSSCSRSINHLSLILKRNKHIFLQNVNIFIFNMLFTLSPVTALCTSLNLRCEHLIFLKQTDTSVSGRQSTKPGLCLRRVCPQVLAVVISLHPAVIQQSLSFSRAALLFVREPSAARYSGQQGAVQSVVERGTHQQHQEAQNLQSVKVLPAQCQAHHPDDQRTQAVQHHTGGGADLFSYADPRKVEKGDADRVAEQSQQDERLVADLTEGIQRVLQDVPRVVGEVSNRDEVHGDEQQRQDKEAKETWKQIF